MNRYLILVAALALSACQRSEPPAESTPEPTAASQQSASETLNAVLDAQPDEVKARYPHRHPKETIEFFGIEPGMTVVEGLPGAGWYSKILVNYLGSEGCLIGADYPMAIWPLFPFGTEEFVAQRATWIEDFKAGAVDWIDGDDGPSVEAFRFGSMPEEFAGTADVVFYPRVLHNLARFQSEGEGLFLDQALADAYAVLKPGGVFGIVQHHARDDMSDEFADGSHGYLKKGWLIERVEGAGFEFVADSDINANDLDQPTEDDIVWRLPPSYAGASEDPELKAAVDAIGESNRMTLKFVKPAG